MTERVDKVVVKKDSEHPDGMPQSFVHLTKNMESELEKRKQDWEDEVSKMQHDFFQMKTSKNGQKEIGEGKTKVIEMKADKNAPRRQRGGAAIFDISHAKTLYCDQADGSKLFKLRFDVKGYEPHEISIKAEGNKLVVTARTEDERSGNKATKQFNRQVDIPRGVDPDNLTSYLSADGILSVEAPVEDVSDEEGEEVEVEYVPDAMMGIEPPLYQHVVDGGPVGGYGSHYSSHTSGGPGHSYYSSHSSGPPGAGFSFKSTGGPSGYSYKSSTTTQPIAPRVSYEYHSCHSSSGHHDCHHKEGPRRPLETHVKRIKNPTAKVDYFKSVSPQTVYHHHHTTPGLTGSALASSILSPSSGATYTSSISSSSCRAPTTTIVNENYRYNEPNIVGGDEDGGKRLKLMVDVGRDYTPEDVHVTLHGPRRIAVQARHHQTVDGRTSKREFSRDFSSAEDMEGYTARASLSPDGKLYIGACMKGNKDQDKVMRNVIADLPDDAKACNLSLEP